MCEFWSAVLTRDGKVLWDRNTNSHETVIGDNRLTDAKLVDRDFVRLEIAPKVIWSKKKTDWVFKVDEPSTLPDWYSHSPRKWESVVWREWRKAMHDSLWKLNVAAIREVLEEIRGIHYLDMHGEPAPEWHLSLAPTWDAAWDAARVAAGVAAGDAARDAAGAAAGDAAWVAARDAAWVAAWDAAGDAAWAAAGVAAGDAAGVAAGVAAGDAAWDAAGAAARDAAGDAAWVAARDAAWDARLYMVVKMAPNMAPRHIAHAEARMEVWRRGYALLCDVNGVLYVYGSRSDKVKQ